MASAFTHRLAVRDDLDRLRTLMDAAITENQRAFLQTDERDFRFTRNHCRHPGRR